MKMHFGHIWRTGKGHSEEERLEDIPKILSETMT